MPQTIPPPSPDACPDRDGSYARKMPACVIAGLLMVIRDATALNVTHTRSGMHEG